MIFSTLITTAFAATLPPSPASPVEINRLALPKVAFVSLVEKNLYLSTFDGNPFGGKDYTFVVPNFADQKSLTPIKLSGEVVWPNLVQKADESIFGVKGVIISGGFLVPGKTNGGLWFSSMVNDQPGPHIELFRGKGYFYHQTEFFDVNGDGKLDILTCRAIKPMTGAAKGDLTWLEPLDRSKPLGKWKETIIGKGCDTFFKLEDVDGDGKVDILAAEFWGQSLTLIQTANGRFDDVKQFTYTFIDKTIGGVFDVQFIDVNGDGKKDILVTDHLGNGKGGVYAYEVPANVKDRWIRHDLSVGFQVLQTGIGQASPGSAQVFFPVKGQGKPHIVVAGDGSQKAYVLVPNGTDAAGWNFTRTIIHDCKCTVGGIAVAYTQGRTNLYIPCYDNGYLVTYSY